MKAILNFLGNNVWYIIAILVCIGVIIGVSIAVFLVKKRMQEKEEPVEESKEEHKIIIDNGVEVEETTEVFEETEVEETETVEEINEHAEEKVEKITKSTSNVYHVTKRKADRRWQVKLQRGERAIKLFRTQKEALLYAEELAKKKGGRVVLHKTTGAIRKKK